MRYCTRCNRPLTAEHHVITPASWQVVPVGNRGGRRLRRVKQYECKMYLTAVNPQTGKLAPTDNPQRNKILDQAYRTKARLKKMMED